MEDEYVVGEKKDTKVATAALFAWGWRQCGIRRRMVGPRQIRFKIASPFLEAATPIIEASAAINKDASPGSVLRTRS